MNEEGLYYVFIIIIALEFVWDRWLHYLNRKNSKQAIPSLLAGVYDEKTYKKSQDYHVALSRFGTLTATISFAIMILTIALGGFGMLDTFLRDFTGYYVRPLVFFGVLFLISDVINTPFAIYQHFVIEKKYGFNKMTPKTFVLDKIKNTILTLIVGGVLLAALVGLIAFMGHDFWWYFWLVIIAFSLFANLFYTSLILPLFNKLSPLPKNDLYTSLLEYCKKVNFSLKNILVMDGSKRSNKGNAFFSGFGNKKKVVLFDTLIENHTIEELTAIFAHEVGHYKKKHIVYSLFLSMILSGFMLFLLSLMIYNSEVSFALGGTTTALHLNLLAFGILYTPLSKILGVLGNFLSRKNEFEADLYAKKTYQAQPLVDALKKMSSHHLTNLTPHPLYVFCNYSHPPLLQRIQALKMPTE